MANVRQLAIAALLTTTATIASAASGSGTTTRYWDCCKPSCAWDKPDELISSVKSCSLDDTPLSGNNDQSGCAGGSAYMCSDQTPWQVDENTAYGFAAVSAASPACCQCYKLSFTSGPVEGKTMIVQATNTGGDVGSTQFDIAVSATSLGACGSLIDILFRCQEVVSESSTHAPSSGVPHQSSGEPNTEDHRPIPARNSPRRFSQAATGVGTGTRALTTRLLTGRPSPAPRLSQTRVVAFARETRPRALRPGK
jgi:hypothetical protein